MNKINTIEEMQQDGCTYEEMLNWTQHKIDETKTTLKWYGRHRHTCSYSLDSQRHSELSKLYSILSELDMMKTN